MKDSCESIKHYAKGNLAASGSWHTHSGLILEQWIIFKVLGEWKADIIYDKDNLRLSLLLPVKNAS